jgi:hypothetical protein
MCVWSGSAGVPFGFVAALDHEFRARCTLRRMPTAGTRSTFSTTMIAPREIIDASLEFMRVGLR